MSPISLAAAAVLARRDYPPGFPNALGPIVPVPATYSDLATSPAPGAVAGIVLGSVASCLFVIALFYTCCCFGPAADSAASWAAASAYTLRPHRRPRQRSPSRHYERRRASTYRRDSPIRVRETVEVLRPRSSGSRMPPFAVPPAPPPDYEPLSRPLTPANPNRPRPDDDGSIVIVDAEPPDRDPPPRRASASRPPGPIPPRTNDDFSDDEIVVVERHSPPPLHRSRSKSNPSRRSQERRRSVVYRDISRRESTSHR